MRVKLQPAYVLHSRPYRDTSAILEVFTAEQGRISLVAKGARRQSKKGSAAASLQPFTPLLISFSGRAELKTLTAQEMAGSAIPLRHERLFSGMYINELLVRLLHRHDPHPRIFASYGETLARLVEETPIDTLLREFEMLLLEELGYHLALDTDGASGAAIEAGQRYRFDADCGLVAFTAGDKQAGAGYPGSDLLAMAAGELGGEQRLIAKRLLREALAVQLGDVPLHSRQLFRGKGPKRDQHELPQPKIVEGGKSL
ncbi:MAG: DNA repair protein RecO (recombination protein O) [Halioglobus sp.]|jgi:DNA repair protein RecO (recombination protein O)